MKTAKNKAEERKEHFAKVIRTHIEDCPEKTAGLQIDTEGGKYKTRIFVTDKTGIIHNITAYVGIVGELKLAKNNGEILTNDNPSHFLEGLLIGICGAVKVYRII